MHEAYKIIPLIKPGHPIGAITAYNDNLLVGTLHGHLIMYNVGKTEDGSTDIQLIHFNKTFSKKAIQQLEVINDQQLLISLTDNLVQLHDLNSTNFNTIYQLGRSKGATLFALNIKKQKSLTGDTSLLARLAVAVKRKLQLYYLKNNEFLKLMDDISLNDVPRCMVWCQETICVGYKGEYILLNLDGEQKQLFPTSSSRSSEPCIVQTADNTFALSREYQTVLVNVQGETEKTKALKWTEIPTILVWDEPYLFGVLPECIEIQTLEPPGSVQILNDLAKIKFLIVAKQGVLYAASTQEIWCLNTIDISAQRKILLETKQFQLALKLTTISNENDEDKKMKIHHIQTLLAYDLFSRKQFHESMKEFLKLETDPYDVIRLFPDLLPQQTVQKTTNYDLPEPIKDLTENELEIGYLALIDYLTEMRHRLQSENLPHINAYGQLSQKMVPINKSTQQLLQIIDTTLLKCYLQTNDALVAPLLRLNHCHLGETEKILRKMGKHNELIILYQTKGYHRRALELLQNEMSIERTVTYLQHLGSEHIGLIIEFADWVLNASPEEGLKIFIEDLSEVEALPRPRILDFLLRSHNSCVIPYLEHVVHVWEDTNPLFHNALIHQYREKIMNDKDNLTSNEHTRKKLLVFLESSQYYTADTVLNQFPTDHLLEESAIILGKLNRHEDALKIYLKSLKMITKAVDYCEKVYKSSTNCMVYVILIKLILNDDVNGNLELALELLEKHASKIDPFEVLKILPNSIAISRICKFLSISLEKCLSERRHMELMKGLLYAEHLQYQEIRLQLQNQHVLVTELIVCPICKKRFSNQSALVRYPNGDVIHFSCQEKRL